MSRHLSLAHPSAAARVTATVLTLAAVAAALAAPARAQSASDASPTSTGVELRPFVGAFLPTGTQRDLLEDAVFTGAQLGYRFTPNVALMAGLGWAPTQDKTGAGRVGGAAQDLDLFQYDLGVEGRLPGALAFGMGGGVWVSPFLGLGAGGRTFNYRDLDAEDAETHFVGHGALGVDVGPRDARWSVRLEGRDYVSAFKGLRGELAERTARNDVSVAAGLTFRFGGAQTAGAPVVAAGAR